MRHFNRSKWVRIMSLAVLAAAIGPSLLQAGIEDPEFWVGAGPNCDSSDLASTIAAAPSHSIIRIANDQTYTGVAIQIVDRHLTIVGGYSSCGDAEPTGVTQLRAAPGQAGYLLAFIASGQTLALSYLELRGGENDTGGGGGLLLQGPLSASLFQVDILGHNSTGDGAGLRILGQHPGPGDPPELTTVTLRHVNIGPAVNVAALRNQASGHGGGLYCENATLRLDDSHLRYNRAGASGGGGHLTGCHMILLPFGAINQVRANQATTGDGGGLYLSDSQLITHDPLVESLRGHPEPIAAPVVIADNTAGGSGGGIYAIDSVIELIDSPVEGNTAEMSAGGLYLVGSQARIVGAQGIGPACEQPLTACSNLRNNSAEFDGAAFVASGSSLVLSRARVSSNTASEAFAGVRASGGQSVLRILNSQISGHTGGVLAAVAGAGLLISGTTIAGNQPSTSAVLGGADSLISIENSIIWETQGQAVSGAASFNVSCSNSHEDGAGLGFDVHDPGFVDPDAGNFRLRSSSLNVDRCGPPQAGQPPIRDLDGVARPQNLSAPLIPDDQSWDRGSFELTLSLFEDRFEQP